MKKIQMQTALFALVLLLAWWQAGMWYEDRLMAEEHFRVASGLHLHGNSLSMAVSERLKSLESLAAFVQTEIASPRTALDEEFSGFSSQIFASSSGICNLAVAPHGVFRYVYPPENRSGMIGQSLFTDIQPAFRGDVQRAADSGDIVLSPPHQMKRGGLGLVARKAVFENETFWGIVSMTIDIPAILDAAGLNFSSSILNMALRDGKGDVFYGDGSVFEADPELYRVELSEGYWELAAVPAAGWAGAVQVPLRMAQMGGLVIICLLIILFYTTVSRQDTLNLEVMERTEDLNRELAERRRAEKALLERDLYLKAIFQAATNVAFIIADANNMQPLILDFSPGAEKAFGYHRNEVLNRPATMLLLPQDHERLYRAAVRIKDDKQSYSGFISLLRRSGEIFPAMYSIHPLLDESGAIYGALGVCIDITEQKKLEEELIRAKEAAEASSQAKAEFTASVSHEMRTPLNAVIGMTDLLLEQDLDPVARDYVATVRSSGLSLLAIINEILDFSRMDARKMTLADEPFDLREALETSMDQVAPWASEKRLDLAYFIDEGVPGWITGDAQRLRQVLVNLLSNAIKFTDYGEVTVSVSSEKEGDVSAVGGKNSPDARCREEWGRLVFHVIDTGIGIPEDRMSRLFIPFSQVDTSLSRKYSGTGLGLAISSRLVELMGGSIWAESSPGIGSRFHFAIPLKPASPPAACGFDQPNYSALAKKRALIAFFRAAGREMLARHVTALGMTAAKAINGGEASLLLAGERVDVVVAGTDLPEAERMWERLGREDMRSVPVIQVAFFGEKSRPMRGRVSSFLTRPVRKKQMAAALLRVFEAGEREMAEKQAAAERSSAEPSSHQNYRILLAEDNPVNQKVALAMLRHLGYRADVAENGRQVLNMVEGVKKYDVILMDIQMPEMDGLQATRLIRSRLPSSEQPRIVAMTAYTMQGDREQCLAAGMDEYISKPVKMEDLKVTLERVTGGA